MKVTEVTFFLFVSVFYFQMDMLAFSSEPSKELSQEDADKAILYVNPPIKPITAKERNETCKKYRSRYISAASSIYYVKKCKLHILNRDEITHLINQIANKKVSSRLLVEVDNRVIAALGNGEPYLTITQRKRTCSQLSNNYAKFDLKTYWITKCKLKLFPDDATFREHQSRHNYFSKPILVLTGKEFAKLSKLEPFKSVLDRGPVLDSRIEVLPIDEACRGLLGKHKYVWYVDSVFIIKKLPKRKKGCYREKVDIIDISKIKFHNKLHELSSSQAVSIPIENKKN